MSQLKRSFDRICDAISRQRFWASRAWGSLHPVTVIIPTLNSARYLDITLEYYARMGVSPIVFVDARSNDETFKIASKFCECVHVANNPCEWVEGMIEGMSRAVPSAWALRVDDDELPSSDLLSLCGGVPLTCRPVISFPRINCGLTRSGQLAYNAYDREDRQFRLYRVNEVEYRSDIHTPGFAIRRSLQMVAPYFLLHFDWAIRSYENRKAKVERYNRIGGRGAGDRYRQSILFEEKSKFRAKVLDASDLAWVAQALARRFPGSCVL